MPSWLVWQVMPSSLTTHGWNSWCHQLSEVPQAVQQQLLKTVCNQVPFTSQKAHSFSPRESLDQDFHVAKKHNGHTSPTSPHTIHDTFCRRSHWEVFSPTDLVHGASFMLWDATNTGLALQLCLEKIIKTDDIVNLDESMDSSHLLLQPFSSIWVPSALYHLLERPKW